MDTVLLDSLCSSIGIIKIQIMKPLYSSIEFWISLVGIAVSVFGLIYAKSAKHFARKVYTNTKLQSKRYLLEEISNMLKSNQNIEISYDDAIKILHHINSKIQKIIGHKYIIDGAKENCDSIKSILSDTKSELENIKPNLIKKYKTPNISVYNIITSRFYDLDTVISNLIPKIETIEEENDAK